MPRKHRPHQRPPFRPVKPREYGTTKAVVGIAFEQAGGAKKVCAFFDLGASAVYGFTDPDAKGCDLSLDRARRLTFVEGITAFAADFASLAGGAFISPAAIAQGEELAALGGDIGRSNAELVSDLLKALADGNISAPERLALRARCDQAIATVVALRNRVTEAEAGHDT